MTKEGKNPHLVEYIKECQKDGKLTESTWQTFEGEKIIKTKNHCLRSKKSVFLNQDGTLGEEMDLNWVGYEESTEWTNSKGVKKEKKFQCQWISGLPIDTLEQIKQVMRGGRNRWSIENEVFNTLKNQGCEMEHNFGHGHHYLSGNFSTIMMLSFGIDQLKEMGCPYFKKALKCIRRKSYLWRDVKVIYQYIRVHSWKEIYAIICTADSEELIRVPLEEMLNAFDTS